MTYKVVFVLQIQDILSLCIGAALLVVGFFLRRGAKRRLAKLEAPTKKQRLPARLFGLMSFFGGWWLIIETVLLLKRHSKGEIRSFDISVFAEMIPVRLFGRSLAISSTVLTTWGIIAVIFLLALAFRLIMVPRLKENPQGLQRALEAAVDGLDSYIGSKLHGMSEAFGAYIFSLGLFLVACAFTELLGIRAPTADITMTLALSLITFFLINYYGFKRRGFFGRIKSLGSIEDPVIPEGASFGEKIKLHLKSIAKPSTIGFPFRLISDLVVPLSLTCRLFGNMFGGMIIIELLYYAMGSAAVALPSIAGLYFNVFHPLIQAFIFITLTLSYIAEAAETE